MILGWSTFKNMCDTPTLHPPCKMARITISREKKRISWNFSIKLKTSWMITDSWEPLVIICNFFCRYALLCKPLPEEWNDQLRQSFLRGFKSFLKMLKMMQVIIWLSKRDYKTVIKFETVRSLFLLKIII